jgi:hypothetical protein
MGLACPRQGNSTFEAGMELNEERKYLQEVVGTISTANRTSVKGGRSRTD